MNIKKAFRKTVNKLCPCKFGICKDKLFGCNCGTFIGLSAGTIGTIALLGGGAYGASQGWFGGGGDDDGYQWSMPPDPRFFRAPEYEETTGARKAWWEKLQQWGGQEGYGAIAPNWGDIWERTKKRVTQSYWGGPEGGTGRAGKIKASAARRGVSESPAMETMMGRMGAMEAGQLGDIATEQGIQRAKFSEAGRMSWLQNIAQMSGLQVPGTWQGATGYMPAQTASPWGDLASAGGSYLGAMGQQKQGQDWMEKMMKQLGSDMPGTTPGTIT